MKNRIIALFLVLMLSFSLFACSKNENGETEVDASNSAGETSASNDEQSSVSGNEESSTEFFETLDKDKKDVILDSEVSETGAIEISDGVYLLEVKSYSGKYVEDGSNIKVKDILSAKIVNYTQKCYQLYTFSIKIGKKTYNFKATTLFPDSQMKLLETSKASCPKSLNVTSAKVDTVAEFEETPSVMLDTFEITYTDQIINVKNLTEEKTSDVYVYYKNYDNGVYFGGITYRVNFGSIEAGKIVQNQASKFSAKKSKIVFVTVGGDA